MDEMEFDTGFMTEDEIEEMTEFLVQAMADDIANDEKRTSVINTDKLKHIQIVYNILKCITKGSCVVERHLHEPYNSTGYVSVVGKNITFSNPEYLIAIAQYASNVEMYPKTDGNVQINFTFHEITTPIE